MLKQRSPFLNWGRLLNIRYSILNCMPYANTSASRSRFSTLRR